MSKRYAGVNSFTSNISKKQKLESNVDDLWGDDDLDSNDVDDCLMLASQAYLQTNAHCTQKNNVSILPSYSGFQQTSKNVFTSTQSNPELTSKLPAWKVFDTSAINALNEDKLQTSLKRSQSFDYSNKHVVESRLKTLEEQYETKVGEVTILRTKLQDIRKHSETEQSKQQKEWIEKLAAKDKQLKGVESELEFKNLEIINLTQKLKEATKINHATVPKTVDSPFFKHGSHFDRSAVRSSHVKDKSISSEPKIRATNQTYYPLKDVIDLSMCEISLSDMCVKDINVNFKCGNAQSQLCKLQPTIKTDINCKFESIYNIFQNLKQCTVQELGLIENQKYIDKVFTISEQLIRNLLRFLQRLETHMNLIDENYVLDLENLLKEDANVNLNQRKLMQDEMGIYATQTLRCVSEILPHNIIVKTNVLLIQEKKSNVSTYLLQILSLIKLIRKLQMSPNFNEFFIAVIKFLHKISLNFSIVKLDCGDVICKIIKEIILSLNSGCVLLCFLQYLNNIVVQNNFLVGICTISEIKEVQIDHKKKMLHYDENICVLQILFTIIEEFLKINLNYLIFERSVVTFIVNSIKYNVDWLFNKEDKCCPCITKVVRLYVNVLYKIIKRVDSQKLVRDANEARQYCDMLRSGVDTLNILNFNLYDVVVKYMDTYSEYKVVIKSILNLKSALRLDDLQVEVLEKIIKSEEVPQIEKEFQNINLWNGTLT